MKTLYIDCTNGVSGDMLLKAFETLEEECSNKSEEDTEHKHHGHAYGNIKNKINTASDIALSIYEVIAKAEATVHGQAETIDPGSALDSVHFHEVGRNQAIKNAMGIGMALAIINPDEIRVSQINDGKGFVDCDHGRIPVPVPAVRAMMDQCGKLYPTFTFATCEDVETEMVTPSGLASLIGIGAKPASPGIAGKTETSKFVAGGMMFIEGTITASAEAKGTRDIGRPGLRMYLIEK